jgi:hypothetical protein
MECWAGGCGPCNTVARGGAGVALRAPGLGVALRAPGLGAGGWGLGAGVVQSCAFLCARGAKFFFVRTKPIFDKGCGIMGFEAIFRRIGCGWWQTIAGRREEFIEREMAIADAVAACWDKVSELRLYIGLMLDWGRNSARRWEDIPTRNEDSTAGAVGSGYGLALGVCFQCGWGARRCVIAAMHSGCRFCC